MLCTLYLSPLCTLFSRKLKFLSLQENRSHFCLWWHIIVIFFCVCVFLFFFPSLTLAVKFQQLVVLCYVLDSVLKSAALKLRCQKFFCLLLIPLFKNEHRTIQAWHSLFSCMTVLHVLVFNYLYEITYLYSHSVTHSGNPSLICPQLSSFCAVLNVKSLAQRQWCC